MILTDEQRELAANNHNLIYSYLNKRKLDEDEYYDLAAIGLCQAASIYDYRGAFSSLAYKCMQNHINQHYQLQAYEKRRGREWRELSMSAVISDNGEDTLTLEDVLSAPMMDIDGLIDDRDCIRRIGDLPERTQRIMVMKGAGFTYREIGDACNITRQRAEQIVRRERDYVMEGLC